MYERAAHWAIGQEDAIRVHLQDLAGGVVSGHHGDLAAKRGEPPQDVVLDAIVVRHNLHVTRDILSALRSKFGDTQGEDTQMFMRAVIDPSP